MFIPTSPLPPGQPPKSPRVRELSQGIRETIEQFQQRHQLTPAEVRQALWHVGLGWRTPGTRNRIARTILFWLLVIGLPVVFVAIMRTMR